MGADLQIHIYEGLTEEDMQNFFSNNLGSKYFHPRTGREDAGRFDKAYEKIAETPSVWVGEWSPLKAGLFEEPETFIPDAMGQIQEIIGEDLPVIDDVLIEKIKKALSLENKTSYRVSDGEPIIKFLEEHRGKRVFTVSW
jgi:hypothetical protein